MTIDPITLARFMVLKGATELVESFSAIPEGALRDSIVSHARVMAETYEEARANGAPIPDPLDLAARSPQRLTAAQERPLALPGKANGHADPAQTPQRRVKITSPEAQAVRLRMAGKTPAEIAEALEIDVADVTAALAAARKAGVKFKALPKVPIGARPKSQSWNTDWARMSGQARNRVEHAAASLSLSPQAYLDLKATLLRMRQAREPWAEIIKACKPVSEEVLWRWVYQARAAGHDIPAKLDDDTPIDVEVVPIRRHYPAYEELHGADLGAVERAAASRGISAQAYNERREYVLRLRLEGRGNKEIAKLVGETETAVKDLIASAKHRWNLTFPPVGSLEGEAALLHTRA